MEMTKRSLVTIDDLTNGEIEGLFDIADSLAENIHGHLDVCRGMVMASLFFEPSTRTRLSFETAMHRLGGSVITVSDPKSTSLAKGESIADMARVLGSYADIIVIRHPWEGAARVIADYAGVPVINAGDGGHEHPTQTLCDLYTLKKERQTIRGLKIALWGDLKHGRTIHSLAFALARFGATILFRPGPGLEIPDYVIRKLTREYGGEVKRAADTGGTLPLDALYMTPSHPHQLAMMPEVSLQVELEKGVDALYVTRLQRERMSDAACADKYPVVNKQMLKEKEYQKSLVMHPLPRVDELDRDVDEDPRSMYFQQAAHGVPVRMALISFLLGAKTLPPHDEECPVTLPKYPDYNRSFGVRCGNPACVSVQATEKYVPQEFKIVSEHPLTLRCVYCEHEIMPKFIASSEWHEGRTESKRYHSANSHWIGKIRPENLIIFNSEVEAEEQGFKPGHFIKDTNTAVSK